MKAEFFVEDIWPTDRIDETIVIGRCAEVMIPRGSVFHSIIISRCLTSIYGSTPPIFTIDREYYVDFRLRGITAYGHEFDELSPGMAAALRLHGSDFHELEQEVSEMKRNERAGVVRTYNIVLSTAKEQPTRGEDELRTR